MIEPNTTGIALPADPNAYAARLYDTLHALDAQAYEVILIECPPDTPGWVAVRDRLQRAATR